MHAHHFSVFPGQHSLELGHRFGDANAALHGWPLTHV